MALRTHQPQRADGPEREGPGQVFVAETIAAGSGHAQVTRARNIGEHPLTLAFERGKITDAEYSAGETYRTLCGIVDRSGKDSTDISLTGSPNGLPWSQRQAEAIMAKKQIEQRMSAADTQIVRKFCGEGIAMSEAVMRVVPCHPNGVLYRLREALSHLSDALRGVNVRVGA